MKTNKERTIMLVFNNGEHVIGKEITEDSYGGVIVLEDPVNLVPDQQTGRLMFYNAVQFSEGNTMSIYTSQLRCEPLIPNEDIFNGYDKQFGSGIVVPDSNIIAM